MPAKSVWQPTRTRLAFSNPYAYRAAYMLGEYDILVRTCYTLIFVGAGEPSDLQTIVARAGHHIRRVFAIPQSFKECPIDRDDIRQNNERAQRAVELMGPLPEEILNSDMLPLFVPADVRQCEGRRAQKARRRWDEYISYSLIMGNYTGIQIKEFNAATAIKWHPVIRTCVTASGSSRRPGFNSTQRPMVVNPRFNSADPVSIFNRVVLARHSLRCP